MNLDLKILVLKAQIVLIIPRWFYSLFFRLAFVLAIGVSVASQGQAPLSLEEGLQYETGRAIFEKVWVSSPSSTTASDGLGPLYNARSCSSCHEKNSILIQLNDVMYGRQFQTFAVSGLKNEGQLVVHYDVRMIELGDEEIVNLGFPDYLLTDLHYGKLTNPNLSARRAMSLAGVGILEQIPEQVIVELSDEDDLNDDGISGRINLVWDISQQKLALGRFGWKASQPNLFQQTAKAFNIDMGISNSMFPDAYGDCTELQHDCFNMAHGNSSQHEGLEAANIMLASVLFFLKNVPIPLQASEKQITPSVTRGESLFLELRCAACHQPQFDISGQVFRPYSDLLLHDMGKELSDGVSLEPGIMAAEWRTAPLWGLGAQTVKTEPKYLHDGRANTLLEAILWHGGEAEDSVKRFRSMTKSQRDDLINFLNTL